MLRHGQAGTWRSASSRFFSCHSHFGIIKQGLGVCFCEILALNYAPGAAAPGTAAPGADAPGA